METGKTPLLVEVIDDNCTQEFTADEQAFLQFVAAPDTPTKQVEYKIVPHLQYAHEQFALMPWPYLPDEVRPLISLFEKIRILAWLEVFLSFICAFLSMVLRLTRLAQACILIGFFIVFQKKVEAVRTMTNSGKLLRGEAVSSYLDENYSIPFIHVKLPVRRLWVLTFTSLPSFAEGALTAIALPHAYSSSPLITMCLGMVLLWSTMVHVLGTRDCILHAKYGLIQNVFDVVKGVDRYQSLNTVWHWVTMGAGSSNLSVIALCGDQMSSAMRVMEGQLVYKIQCHDENSCTARVINRFILTAGPRMALKILLFGRMGSAAVSDRLNMLLAIGAGLFSIVILGKKAILRVYSQRVLLMKLRTWPEEYFPSNSPPGTFSIPKIFCNPFAKQFVYYHGDDRLIEFDASLYIALVLLLYTLWSGSQLLPAVQQLIQDLS